MTTPFRFAYLHGFASSSKSYKGVQLAKAFRQHGVTLELPDMNQPSFSKLTYSGALSVMDQRHAEAPDKRWRLIGSSMGGCIATRWAQLNPDAVDRLLLLCPGFDLPSRWMMLLGEEAFERWQLTGSHLFEIGETRAPLWWKFIEDAKTHPPIPSASCETLIIHGRADEVVPLESSLQYVHHHDNASLIEVDSDHGLVSALPEITAQALALFEIA